jgi:signal transduction histidine kinase
MAKIKVRARAVDMLGRQQIAGIPTAIHELFKNAHDAYADHVEVDFYRDDGLLILRDDGFGMSREDFESRWLTLGTESKVGANEPGGQGAIPGGGPPRPIMGEKGIGRLAIAAIGPQVLVLTRPAMADADSSDRPLVASLVNWRLFEIPGLDLDSIDIPVVEIPSADEFDAATLKKLADRVRANVESLEIGVDHRDEILSDLNKLDFSPAAVQAQLGGPDLGGGGHGTHFYVRPVNPILADDIDTATDDSASPLEKMLLGFSNTMMPGRPAPVIKAEFRDHQESGEKDELIGGGAFFTPDEFEAADHHIEGEFDAYGQFVGSVSVYKRLPIEHTIQWQGSTGKPTECGPFRIKFAYVQGRATETRLPPAEWAEISSKLNRIGGLYVYRDGIRVLPYGNSDYDFLNIERRRTKSASDWFFSYRRIFGAIEITHTHNSNLVEKAGREGFRANRAYRQFTDMLERFFERLALDFFRETARFGDEFNAIKNALADEAKLLARREQSTRHKRRAFTEQLDAFFTNLERGAPSAGAAEILDEFSRRLANLPDIAGKDPDRAAQILLAAELHARESTHLLIERHTVRRPRGVGPTKVQQRDWGAYVANLRKLHEEVFQPLIQEIDQRSNAAALLTNGVLDRRRRISASLEARRDAATAAASRLRREVQERVKSLATEVDDTLKTSIAGLSSDIEKTFVELGQTDTAELNDEAIADLQSQWERRVESAAEGARDLLEGLRDQLETLVTAVQEQETLDATTAALETQAESLRDQLDNYVDLAQVGMALGIVQHEFANTVRGIRGAIRKLKPWARGTPELATLESELRTGFNHLDAYLALFTPMSRRLNREAVDLSGEEIRRYLLEVFGDRLERHEISLTASPQFDEGSVHTFASTILPSFVNLVDNAIYWIVASNPPMRSIELDADENGFLISNSGVGIDAKVADRIFEFGQTTKPGGRGMGLYLSREALRKEDFDLVLEQIGAEVSPVFRISTKKDTEAETA